eukprot:5148940-Prymnesium_polylepis.1
MYCFASAVFLGGIFVRMFEQIAGDKGGSPALAAEFLGLRSSDEVVVTMIGVAFAMPFMLALTLGADVYWNSVQAHLRSKWSICTMDPQFVKRCVVHLIRHDVPPFVAVPFRPSVCIVRDSKQVEASRYLRLISLPLQDVKAASDARYIHDVLRKMLRKGYGCFGARHWVYLPTP